VRDGKIVGGGATGASGEADGSAAGRKLDVGGPRRVAGFVDSHTHLIHAASRAEEYELKIQGASYEAIARKGGGILNSAKTLRAATAEALKRRARGGAGGICGARHDDGGSEERVWAGRSERAENPWAPPGTECGTAAGNRFDIPGSAHVPAEFSQFVGWQGTLHQAAGGEVASLKW